MNPSLLPVAVGIGLVVSLLFSELFGLAAGGMVVPGYFALFINQPFVVLLSLTAALLTYFFVHLLAQFAIIYGRRRTVMMILVGYLMQYFLENVLAQQIYQLEAFAGVEISVIGYIIPGLVAIWMDRQGIIETLSTLISASV
ncbi:MAG TPA: poly-gamma-glutamate biosynthesis protein PgsC, partial [Pirellulaceae bacterium]